MWKPLLFVGLIASVAWGRPLLSKERMVFQTDFGDIEMAFYPEVAPKTYTHILKLAKMGCYTTNHFFRVDRGFVAQVADCTYGRTAKLNTEQKAEDEKHVVLEVVPEVKHHAGVISMGRHDDPDSNGSSFSILLGDAPHLDMKYTIFGEVTAGMEALRKMEGVETRRQGIFVMPNERINIHVSYIRDGDDEDGCHEELTTLKERFMVQEVELQRVRAKCLPGS